MDQTPPDTELEALVAPAAEGDSSAPSGAMPAPSAEEAAREPAEAVIPPEAEDEPADPAGEAPATTVEETVTASSPTGPASATEEAEPAAEEAEPSTATGPGARLWWGLGLAGILAVVATLAWFVVPYPVSVDGTTRWLTLGTTLHQMEERGLVSSKPGDLVSVKGKVLKVGGGTPVVMYVNGRIVDPSSPVWPGSTVKTVGGESAVEATVTEMITFALPVSRPGRGPVLDMQTVGSPGVRKVTKGARSGDVLRSEIVTAAVATVVLRRKPLNAGRVVALTFDDGPQPSSTPAILAILRKYKIKATFFMVGREARKYPALARQVVAEGHTIGNHSLSHQGLQRAGKKWAEDQVVGGASAIKAATGVWPKWYRPAGGSYNDVVLEVARSAGEHLVMWNVDPDDWQNPSLVNLVNRVVASAKPGAIVLMHDGGGNRSDTIAALPQIITRLSAAGYSFVTMDQLYGAASKPAPKPVAAPAPAPAKKP